jgi:hypothetical protein
MNIGSNKRSVSVSGNVEGVGSAVQNSFKSSQELKNVLGDFNAQLNGSAAVPGGLTATASAMQTSQLSATAISLKGLLRTATRTTPAGEGAQRSLASSIFEVRFSLDTATNFTLKGAHGFFSQDHTMEKVDFSFTSSNGQTWATMIDLNEPGKTLALPAGSYKIKFNTAVGAQTDPLGDNGIYDYAFSLVSS